MATCTGDSVVQTIERTECIGNSLVKINSNFKNLDIAICESGSDILMVSTALVELSSKVTGTALAGLSSDTFVIGTTLTETVGTGTTTTFAVSGYTNNQPDRYQVFVAGLLQRAVSNYTVASGNVVFTTPPPVGALVTIIALRFS